MKQMGIHSLVSDPQLYARWRSEKNGCSFETLDLVCTKHVDDLKAASGEQTFDVMCKDLTKEFGELTVQKRCFEHLGICHRQLDDSSADA